MVFPSFSTYNWQVPIGKNHYWCYKSASYLSHLGNESFVKVKRKCVPNYDDDLYITNSLIAWNLSRSPLQQKKRKGGKKEPQNPFHPRAILPLCFKKHEKEPI